jgi:hypothetical protein
MRVFLRRDAGLQAMNEDDSPCERDFSVEASFSLAAAAVKERVRGKERAGEARSLA